MQTGYRGVAEQTSGGPPNFTAAANWVVLPNEAVLVRPGSRGRARRHVELHEDVAHVPVDRLLAQEELAGDRLVGLARGDEPQHLELARAEAVSVRRRTRVGGRGRRGHG